MAEGQSNRIRLREINAESRVAKAPEVDEPACSAWPVSAIAPGRRVTLHFSLELPTGELIDSNFGGRPAVCVIGDGSLLPGFEQLLYGLEVGAEKNFELPPEQSFGHVNADNIQKFPRYRFAPDLPLKVGLVVDFADAAGNTQAGVVAGIDGREVEVDFNHPLAGRSILFKVQILGIEPGAAG